MFQRPDYDVLRAQTPFTWRVSATYLALIDASGVPIRDFYLDPEAGIEVFRRGGPAVRDLYGPDMPLWGPSTPPVSYGHVNGLGAELLFPEGGEVAHQHMCGSLEDAVEAVRRDVDFSSGGMAPFYLGYRRRLQKAFPDEKIGFAYGLEGPLTTAYELRGDGIFYDIMDQPEAVRRFLQIEVDSILAFHRFRCEVLDGSPVNPDTAGMADDIASMVPPKLWPDVVLPAWERYYSGMTTGRRNAHVEDLRPDQLPFLERIGLWSYDPSISPKLSPPVIRDRCRVPFGWRLANFHYRSMAEQDVRDWVFQAVADGAGSVHTLVCAGMVNAEHVVKVQAFKEAATEAERMLTGGATRADIATCVSNAGRERFWDHWPE